MFQVEKRDGTIAEFQMKKITDAIGKAFGAKDMQFSDDMLQMLALRVTADFQSKIKDGKISVEAIQDSVENVLIQCGYAEVAKAYILYRKQREKIRNNEIDDHRLQRDRGQLRKSRGLACQRELDRNVFCRRSDLKQFRRDHSQLLVIRDL